MQTDIRQTTRTDLSGGVPDYSVDTRATESVGEQDETYWDNSKWTQYFGYYKQIPELKKAIDALATWILGKDYTTDARTTAILENITGWGEDTFNSILWNLIVTKKVAGDSFAEIIRNPDTGTLINLKTLDPGSIRIICNRKGKIKRYEQRTKTGTKEVTRRFDPSEILHLCNDRIADEIHGTSVIEACEWVILARNEAMADWRRILHRATIRVLRVDEDDKSRLANLKRDYAEAIKKGEVLIIPGKPADSAFEELTPPPSDTFISWIKYLENFFYQALGVPKVILGGSEEFTEASSKIGYLTFEQVYTREVTELKADLWNQLAIRVEFNKPASLESEMLQSGEKSKAQVGFQPNDITAGRGK